MKSGFVGLLSIVYALCAVLGAVAAQQEQVPGEWEKLEKSGVTLLYHAGDKDLALQILPVLVKKAAGCPSGTISNGISRLIKDRDKLLRFAASQLGLDRPTETMSGVLDEFGAISEKLGSLVLDPRRVMLWRKETLKKLLVAGGKVPGFSYERETDSVSLKWGGNITSGESDAPALGYTPIVIKADSEETPTQQTEEEMDNYIRWNQATRLLPGMACHEFVEASLMVDCGLSGPFRRWFTDGAANCIAEECLRKFLGKSAADEYGRTFDAAQYRLLKPRVDLLSWRASEWEEQMPDAAKGELSDAYYAFATFEVKRLIKLHGSGALAKVLQQIKRDGSYSDEAILSAVKTATGEDIEAALSKYGNECKDPFRGVAVENMAVGLCVKGDNGRWSIDKNTTSAPLTLDGKQSVCVHLECAVRKPPAALKMVLAGPMVDGKPGETHTCTAKLESKMGEQIETRFWNSSGEFKPGGYTLEFYLNNTQFASRQLKVTGK